MPYYQWTGVDLLGQTRKGKQRATSPDFLEKTLFEQNIAVVEVWPVRSWPWQRWNQEDSLAFFKKLHVLLSAGVFTTDALTILLKQARHESVVTIIEQLYNDVCNGISLSSSLEKFPEHFDNLTITLIRAGEESGSVGNALEALCEHIEFKQSFYRKLRAAALMPMITLSFFVLIALAIITLIIPKFAILFLQNQQQLPWMTKMLLATSEFLRSGYALVFVLIPLLFIVMRRFKKIDTNRVDRLILSVPFLSTLIIETSLTYFFKIINNSYARWSPSCAIAYYCSALGE